VRLRCAAISAAVLLCVVPRLRADSLILTFAAGQANESWSNSATNSGILTLSLGALGVITMTGYSCANTLNGLCNSVPTESQSVLPNGLTDINGGIGLSNGAGGETEIPQNAFVTVDLSKLNITVSSLTMGFVDVVDGWDVYTTSVANQLASGTPAGHRPGAIAQGNNATDFPTFLNINSSIAQGASFGTSTFDPPGPLLTVTALQTNCDACPMVELTSFNLTYQQQFSSPEPTTSLLAGFALLGLVFAAARLRRRA
jgi:MYXO-CTERM domain-containing protein